MFPPHYLLNPTFHAECWMLPTRVQGTTRTPLLAECYISWMLQTRVQGTILPYTFPPHYLLNVTFHGCYTNQSSGHHTTIHISTPLLAECYISWMLPTRVQGTILPYTFPSHYLHFILNVGCYQPRVQGTRLPYTFPLHYYFSC